MRTFFSWCQTGAMDTFLNIMQTGLMLTFLLLCTSYLREPFLTRVKPYLSVLIFFYSSPKWTYVYFLDFCANWLCLCIGYQDERIRYQITWKLLICLEIMQPFGIYRLYRLLEIVLKTGRYAGINTRVHKEYAAIVQGRRLFH